jgi:hypothetical protein
MSMGEYVLTGRLVQGDPYKMQPKKDNQNKTVIGTDGQPVLNFYVALAVPKGDPKWPTVKVGIDADAARFWPNGETGRADFASKIIDGDSTAKNKQNKRWCDYEGFPGCNVVKLGTLYPPKVQYWDSHQNKWVDSVGGHVKIGDYVSVLFDTASNKSLQTPGIHLNPKLIGLEKAGDAIVGQTGADGNDAFGSRGPGAATGGQTAGAGGSYTGYMDTDTPPPPADDTPPPPPSGAEPTMTAKAGNKTYKQFRDAKWTHKQLVDGGYVVDDGVPY